MESGIEVVGDIKITIISIFGVLDMNLVSICRATPNI
jgi:hypothetical protein